MDYLKVKNWESFQHYKDRNPPWIKLHRSLLTDYEFSCLQDASKLHLVLLWLLASQTNNQIPVDPAYLKNMLHLEETPDLNELIEKGFLLCDSNMLAGCKQVATLETETETEKDKKNGKRFSPPTVPEVAEYVREKGYSIDPEYFVNFYASKNWMVGKNKMSSWKHAIAGWEKRNGDKKLSGGSGKQSAAERNAEIHDYLDAKIRQGLT